MMISACWIVKNEADHLADSICSVRNCAQELIVVDTGSTDDTVWVASKWGARVEHFTWDNDFSAARNFCLSLATGDYIIFIDGDEFFSPPLQQEDREIIVSFFEKTAMDVMQIHRIEIDEGTGQILGGASYGRILRRSTIHYENRIHELPRLKNGKVPRSCMMDAYCLMHTGYSTDRSEYKLLRNIEILEIEQPELQDQLSLFHNKAYLMREYLALKEYEKAFANCRYLLDHMDQWKAACRLFAFNYIQRFYGALKLAAVKRFWFSRKEIYEKLILGVKENYPDSREAVLIDLYYQVLFDYREDRFLEALLEAEICIRNKAPAAVAESRQAEALILGKGALAAYYRGDKKQAAHWAGTALKMAPETNTKIMQAVIHGTYIAQDEIGRYLLQQEYKQAYDLIIPKLKAGSLDHTLLESLLIVAEKTTGRFAESARMHFETAMELLDEAIELTDIINTNYTAYLGQNPYQISTAKTASHDLLSLRRLAAPILEKAGLLDEEGGTVK